MVTNSKYCILTTEIMATTIIVAMVSKVIGINVIALLYVYLKLNSKHQGVKNIHGKYVHISSA
jgi:hypothetical protein